MYVVSKNSCMIMLSESEDIAWNLAIAVPKPKTLHRSRQLLGAFRRQKHDFCRMFAELVASKKGKIALVSVYLDKIGEMQAQEYFSRLIDKVMKSESQKEPTAT